MNKSFDLKPLGGNGNGPVIDTDPLDGYVKAFYNAIKGIECGRVKIKCIKGNHVINKLKNRTKIGPIYQF